MTSGAPIGMAVLFVLMLLGPFVLALVALVAGIAARRRIRQSEGTLRGEGLAMAGIICGALCLVVGLGFLALGFVGYLAAARTQAVAPPTPAGSRRAAPVPGTPVAPATAPQGEADDAPPDPAPGDDGEDR